MVGAIIGASIGALAVGIVVGFFIFNAVQKKRMGDAQNQAKKLVEDAKTEASSLKKEALLEAKEEALKLKNENDNDIRERRAEVQRMENRLVQREEALDRKEDLLDKKIQSADDMKVQIENQKNELVNQEKELEKKAESISKELERVSGLSKENAKAELVASIEDDARKEAGVIVRNIEEQAREEGEKKAREIITLAIQKCATDQTSEVTVTSVALPNDEMKGRIIGREGRNIRALEAATGVEIVVDDTPEAIVISAFDPIRREVCRLALHQLVTDGRIHPARIEEVVQKVKKQLDNEVIETGKRTAIDLGIHGLHPELIRIVGKMKYRSSYGQNLLQHARETANLCAVMASELGLNPKKAKRAGLLHDIGKVPDEESELPHALYGAKIAEKYKEKPDICNAIAAHHDECDMNTLLAPIVQVCDAISGARPGARREIVEAYIKRLNDLEAIAMSYPGVTKTYAIQAGRELRVIVGADKMDDAETEALSGEIANKIQNEMTYPGQVKITVIRETRSVAYAK